MNDASAASDHNSRLFESGDFHAAALSASGGWERHAARALLGIGESAAEALQKFAGEKPTFYHAASLWLAGDDLLALRILQDLKTPEAKALRRLVGRDRIHVLAQLPASRWVPHVVLSGIGADKKFQISNHALHSDDPSALADPPDSSVFDWFDEGDAPDFYICSMLEWHCPPRDIHEAPFPIFAQTADTDLHIQKLRRWLPSFDALIVSDSTERAMVERLVPGRRVVAAASPFGWPTIVNPAIAQNDERPIDVFVSGMMLRAFYPDKAQLIIRVLRDSSLNVLVVDGAVGRPEYLDLMSRSKTTLCYTRNQGAMLTRGIDALGMGCIPIIPRNNVFKLFMPDEGEFEYAPDFSDIVDVTRAAVAAFTATDPVARAAHARETFDPRRVASIYMRGLTVEAALCANRAGYNRIYEPERDSRTNSQFIMWPIRSPSVALQYKEHNVDEFRGRLRKSWNAETANNLAREFIVSCAEARRRGDEKCQLPQLRYALRVLEFAIAREPERLVLWLNYVRAGYFLGDARLREKAKLRLAEALDQDPARWRVSVHDDILPPDYVDNLTDRHGYFSAIARVPIGRDACDVGAEDDLKRYILASLHWLAGWVFGDENRFVLAHRLNPAHGLIAYDYVLSRLRTAAPLDASVVDALRAVVGGTHLFAQAASVVLGDPDRWAGSLSEEEICGCRELLGRYQDQVIALERYNFTRGIGPFHTLTSALLKGAEQGGAGSAFRIALILCDFDRATYVSPQVVEQLELLPFSERIRATPFFRAGLPLVSGTWSHVIGNTLRVEYDALLNEAVERARSHNLLFLYAPHAFLREFKQQISDIFAGRRPALICARDPGTGRCVVVAVRCSRYDYSRVNKSCDVSQAELISEPYGLVHRLARQTRGLDVLTARDAPITLADLDASARPHSEAVREFVRAVAIRPHRDWKRAAVADAGALLIALGKQGRRIQHWIRHLLPR